MIVGIDDTDSAEGMCTTFLCAVLVADLTPFGAVSTPRLVRLNPCIPYKTRGNGAVSFEIACSPAQEGEVKELVEARVRELSEVQAEETNPGIVFIPEARVRALLGGGGDGGGDGGGSGRDVDELPELLARAKWFYEAAVRDVLQLEQAYALLAALQLEYLGLKNERGLIGALAAASFLLLQKWRATQYDFTYELMAYREPSRWGTPRVIDEASVWRADEATYPLTWDTVDHAAKRLVLAPHSPCPVLFGIRGESVEALYTAYALIRAEPAEHLTLFLTNQGTDFHLIIPGDEAGGTLQDCHSYMLEGVVASDPRTLEGGHVVFSLALPGELGDGCIDCIAYEPTKGFRAIVRQLRAGDHVRVYGSFKSRTLNLEKLELRTLNQVVLANPRCEQCGRPMESAGRSQGYRCRRCRTARPAKELQLVARALEEGLYEVPPVARRHIAKPLIRLHAAESRRIHPSR
jgi:tRNA(Ile2)-agmatinylcytidine synthase